MSQLPGLMALFLPLTAWTHHHAHRGLKQHGFITSHFCRLAVQPGSHRTKSRRQRVCVPLWRSKGASTSMPFPASRKHPHAPARGPVFLFKAGDGGLRPSHMVRPSLTYSFLPSSASKEPCDHTGPAQMTQDHLPVLWSVG